MNLDARERKRSTVRASHALARRTSIQHVEELIAKQLGETDRNHTVTRIGEQVGGGTFRDGPTVVRIVIGVATEDVVKGKVVVVEEHVPHVCVHACIVYHDLVGEPGLACSGFFTGLMRTASPV